MQVKEFHIKGVIICFKTDEPVSPGIAEAYVQHGIASHGKRLARMDVEFDGEMANIDYTLRSDGFVRIRRITGYLTSSTDSWNGGKQRELHDRVSHT